MDGGFTPYSNYSVCSKTCGTGVQTRTRSCSNPLPLFGGRNCSGTYVESRKCNTQPCPGLHLTVLEWVFFMPENNWFYITTVPVGGLRKKRHLFIMESKLHICMTKTNHPHTYSQALHQLHELYSSFNYFIALSVCFVIG